MERVLQAIAKQANLDRILFTPSLKKLYFDLAVGSGGGGPFKHAESVRSGLSFAADKAGDRKHVLLFCAAHELVHGYDLLHKLAAELKPVVCLAIHQPAPESMKDTASFLQFGRCGWLQFLTHTQQELYDHLAMAYHMVHAETVHPPALIFHSAIHHEGMGDLALRDDVDMGNPLTGLQTSKKSGDEDPFAAALAAVKNKQKEKPTLRGQFETSEAHIRETYAEFGYVCDDGLPFVGECDDGPNAAVTCVPPETQKTNFVRPLCFRPFDCGSLAGKLTGKKRIAVIEPQAGPGESCAAFYGEVSAALSGLTDAQLVSVEVSGAVDMLDEKKIGAIRAILDKPAESSQKRYTI